MSSLFGHMKFKMIIAGVIIAVKYTSVIVKNFVLNSRRLKNAV
jgi:hypothetical protein